MNVPTKKRRLPLDENTNKRIKTSVLISPSTTKRPHHTESEIIDQDIMVSIQELMMLYDNKLNNIRAEFQYDINRLIQMKTRRYSSSYIS